ncbi:MAG: tRNA uridine-5-carboxymethylaminomethyl(34) synthesis GTPase MnmE [Croceibacterium sp.]
MDTIFALSSGIPPAGIAVVRISGSAAGPAFVALAGALPDPRRASLVSLHDETGELLDRGLALWFPGPNTVTGEDLAELHLHGGRAVVSAVEAALSRRAGLRRAEPGEFTRRAFANGRIDLAEAEGLADLLEAETELQRVVALSAAGGALSRRVEGWRERLLTLSAVVEAALDFGDEDDAAALPATFAQDVAALAGELEAALAEPSTDVLREGFRVVLAGPPNVGKSSLFNVLVDSEAAITTPEPGTTRDVLERSVAVAGIPFTFVDTAGLRADGSDPVERIGIARAGTEIERAGLVLWLGPESRGPAGAWEIEPQSDRPDWPKKSAPRHRVSAVTQSGIAELRADLVVHARSALPRPGQASLNGRQRRHLVDAAEALEVAQDRRNALIIAEELRIARTAFDKLTGRAGTEDVLDALFGRFCIGK